MDFESCFEILIFDPKWGFCMGYSLCMMVDLKKCLISGIFDLFSRGFLHRPTVNNS